MAIREAQLKTRSGQGSITQSKDTYATIKKALEASNTLYADKKYEIFLQGSYGNDTNVYADSDVDIVIKLNSCFSATLRGCRQNNRQHTNPGLPTLPLDTTTSRLP
jgi:Nucleotidyltransferase domain